MSRPFSFGREEGLDGSGVASRFKFGRFGREPAPFEHAFLCVCLESNESNRPCVWLAHLHCPLCWHGKLFRAVVSGEAESGDLVGL